MKVQFPSRSRPQIPSPAESSSACQCCIGPAVCDNGIVIWFIPTCNQASTRLSLNEMHFFSLPRTLNHDDSALTRQPALTPPNLAAILDPGKSGSSSVVECFLAKEDVAGSTPVSRSK